MSAHSPGPWDASWSPMAIYDKHGYCVVRRPAGPAPLENWPANARLIAAAPELLALLRALVTLPSPSPGLASEQARALIARIEGEPPPGPRT